MANDELVGQALCTDCYDYVGAVLWNSHAPDLWRRTSIAVTRALATEVGISVSRLRQVARLSFVKVAEFQRRGLVHLHVLIRLDGAEGPAQAPPPGIDVATLLAVVRSVAATVDAPMRDQTQRVRWGRQFDAKALNDESTGDVAIDVNQVRRIGAYLAKYATKSAHDGSLDRRISSLNDLADRDLSAHLRRMVETAWQLGAEGDERLRRWAHTLGFAGHFLTKSRHYSVTFAFLRGNRQRWQIERQRIRQGQPLNLDDVVTIGRWVWVGSGWCNSGDARLVSALQQERERSRQCARGERSVNATFEREDPLTRFDFEVEKL